jgi:hypothetical protein
VFLSLGFSYKIYCCINEAVRILQRVLRCKIVNVQGEKQFIAKTGWLDIFATYLQEGGEGEAFAETFATNMVHNKSYCRIILFRTLM